MPSEPDAKYKVNSMEWALKNDDIGLAFCLNHFNTVV
jgi:hypothetical protein